jgi:hypothetical protein
LCWWQAKIEPQAGIVVPSALEEYMDDEYKKNQLLIEIENQKKLAEADQLIRADSRAHASDVTAIPAQIEQ